MPPDLDPAYAAFRPVRRESPTEGMRRIERDLRSDDFEYQERPRTQPNRLGSNAGRSLEGYNASIGAQGPLSAGLIGAGDPETGKPQMVGGRVQAGPLSYQYTQPTFKGAPAGQQVGVSVPFDADSYFGVTAQQTPGQGRTYGANVGGEGWNVSGGYNPTSKSVNANVGYQANFAEGGPVYDELGNVVIGDNTDYRNVPGYGAVEAASIRAGQMGQAVGQPIQQAAIGISDIPGSIGSYLAETSQKPDPSQRMAEDIQRVGSAFVGNAMSSPTEFAKTVGGFLPGIGEAISAYDAKHLYGDLQKAEAEGDTGKADTLRQLYGLATAGAVPGIGIGARVAGKVAQGAERAAARELSSLGFYSHAAEVADALPQAKGSPQQMRAMLKGVKEEELAGFDAAFGDKKSVTKDEIASHFKERMPQIEETVLGTPKFKDVNEMQAAHDAALERGDTAAANRISQDWESQFQGNTKFSQYTLPGGENYREVLLKLNRPQAKVVELEGGGGRWGVQMPDGTISSRYYDKFDAEQAVRFDAQKAGVTFTSQHWDDPDVLAHLRMADRTGPNGEKILHVEEIQSDWGQKGKKEGFADSKAATQWAADSEAAEKVLFEAQNQHAEVVDRIRLLGEPLEPFKRGVESPRAFERREAEHFNKRDALLSADPDYQASRQRLDAAKDAIRALGPRPSSGIPTAPYVTNTQAWTDLALKRALREAAEGGYDKLVWTPGAEQAKRYSLSNQVDRLQYIKNDDGTYAVIPYKNERPLHQIERDNIPDKELESLFGRDVAEKMRAYEGDVDGNARSLSGENLEVGGSGMKGYYDKIVPNQLSKLVKKLDPEAKIGTYDLVTKKGGKVADEAALNENSQLIEQGRFWDDARGENVSGYRVTSPGGQELGVFEDLPDAHDALAQALGSAKEPDTILKTPSLTITPKMREAIMKGQTAFAEGGEVEAPAQGGPVGGQGYDLRGKVDHVLGSIAEKVHNSGLNQRDVSYLLRKAATGSLTPSYAYTYAGEVLNGNTDFIMYHLQKYPRGIRVLSRLDTALGGSAAETFGTLANKYPMNPHPELPKFSGKMKRANAKPARENGGKALDELTKFSMNTYGPELTQIMLQKADGRAVKLAFALNQRAKNMLAMDPSHAPLYKNGLVELNGIAKANKLNLKKAFTRTDDIKEAGKDIVDTLKDTKTLKPPMKDALLRMAKAIGAI